MNLSFASLFGSFLFGSIGMAGFVYGKKTGLINPMIIGGALMIFPYFVTTTWVMYVVGTISTLLMLKFPE